MIQAGASGEARLTVRDADTAKAIAQGPEDDFPAVLATSRMVALMELAAARAMRPLLEAGQLSVGVAIRVEHRAATPVGCEVRAVATYLGPEGRLHRFKLEAFDPAGPIGDGDHSRAIVGTERLLEGAERRRK